MGREEEREKIFASHVNVHQKVTSAKEDFKNQGNGIIHSVYTSQPLSPATCITVQWTYKQGGHGGRDEGYAWAQHH